VIAIAVRTGKHHAQCASQRWRSERPAASDQLVWEPEALDDVPTQHALMRVEGLLQQLRERERAAFVLRFVQGMTSKEVADTLGVSLATARRRFSRAKARLNALAGRDVFLTSYV
jgi:RNA polymerase sigma factor (sigma-70 family)